MTSIVPVIEIPQLCVNDRYKNRVKSWKVNYKGNSYNVGHFVFYKHIVPIVLDVAEKVGFQYLILFVLIMKQVILKNTIKTWI